MPLNFAPCVCERGSFGIKGPRIHPYKPKTRVFCLFPFLVRRKRAFSALCKHICKLLLSGKTPKCQITLSEAQ